MHLKLYDSELKVMEILWREGETPAKDIAAALSKQVGWSKTTTYTVIKKCLDKGAAARREPGFLCRAKMYGGAADRLVASLLSRRRLSRKEIEDLKKLVEDLR